MRWKGWDLNMKSTDEQLREIMKRSERIKAKQNEKKVIAFHALSVCACLVLLIAVSLHLPSYPDAGVAQEPVHYGSLLLSSPYMGYVLVCVLAFLLGVLVTLLILRLHKMRKGDQEKK